MWKKVVFTDLYVEEDAFVCRLPVFCARMGFQMVRGLSNSMVTHVIHNCSAGEISLPDCLTRQAILIPRYMGFLNPGLADSAHQRWFVVKRN